LSRFSHYEPCQRCTQAGRDRRGDNCGVWVDGSAHCFACGWHRFPKHYRGADVEAKLSGPKSVLPADFTREVPAKAWQWLLQYGLPYTYWQPFVGYSPQDERLVFLVGTPTQFAIGRHVPLQENATEGNAKPRKWYVWGDSHKHCERIGPEGRSPIVLVEDIVSAHKVGQVTEAIPLFGTRIFDAVVYYLMTINKPIKLWLDKDQESRVKSMATWLQGLTENPVDVIITDHDPKVYTVDQLSKLIK
jgi:hypothetical protein